jgi:hypothetical protein
MCRRFGGITLFTLMVRKKIPSCHFQHPPQLVHYPEDGGRVSLRNVEIFNDCGAATKRKTTCFRRGFAFCHRPSDAVRMNDFESRTGNFSTGKSFCAPLSDRSSVFLEPLVQVCSIISRRCDGGQFCVTAGCEKFDFNSNSDDYFTKQVVNWRFFATPLKRFIKSERVPLVKLPPRFVCMSIWSVLAGL